MYLRAQRELLRISQTRLARLAGVSRFKICLFEMGDGELSEAEEQKIDQALEAEAARLRNIAVQFEASGKVNSVAEGVCA